MIHYGHSDDLREATTAFNGAHPDNEWLCRHVVDVNYERRFQRVLEQFEDRFGAPPRPASTTSR